MHIIQIKKQEFFNNRLLKSGGEPGCRLLLATDCDGAAGSVLARRLILNTYKTLLTRGQKGCFVYCEDEALREYFKRMVTATDC